MDRGDQVTERLQVLGLDRRDANQRLYRRHESGQIRLVSEIVRFVK